MQFEKAIIVVNKTRLELLIERFNTKAQAKFYIEHSGGNFSDYEAEHGTFMYALDKIREVVSAQIKYKVIERQFVPNFLFAEDDLIIVVGQDGLVANTAKYARGQPILAINPDPARYDGILLPFDLSTFSAGLHSTLEAKASVHQVTMAEASMNDGQKLLAFNDLFIGPSSHVSARYRISYAEQTEQQSSSGIIVSTGAGSTGWLSSLINMANGITSSFRGNTPPLHLDMDWDDNALTFIVREPFQSRHSQISLTAGRITEQSTLRIESFMPANGIIFSDGIEADFLHFNSGSIVEVGIAEQKAKIIAPR